jgi:glyceraldehyde-3-phosphate dehydrogenase/erythrose-4-phosphate dehydrogenase
VRVPLTNSSLTDCVFEVKKATTAEEVNAMLKVTAAALAAACTSAVSPRCAWGRRLLHDCDVDVWATHGPTSCEMAQRQL